MGGRSETGESGFTARWGSGLFLLAISGAVLVPVGFLPPARCVHSSSIVPLDEVQEVIARRRIIMKRKVDIGVCLIIGGFILPRIESNFYVGIVFQPYLSTNRKCFPQAPGGCPVRIACQNIPRIVHMKNLTTEDEKIVV